MSTFSQPGSGMWCCTMMQDQETGVYIAHCLNLHMKVGGKTADEAANNLGKIIKVHYEYCYEFDPEGLSLTAPAEDWVEYGEALKKALKENPESIVVDVIELRLRAPKVPDHTMPLSCQRVDIEQAQVVAA
jgi:hypothetical protein